MIRVYFGPYRHGWPPAGPTRTRCGYRTQTPRSGRGRVEDPALQLIIIPRGQYKSWLHDRRPGLVLAFAPALFHSFGNILGPARAGPIGSETARPSYW